MSANGTAVNRVAGQLEQRLKELRHSFDDGIRIAPETATRVSEPFLLLTISGTCFAYPVAHALEVLQVPTIVPLPGSSAEVAGIINFRGRILTVSTLHTRLELAASARGPGNRIIVTKGLSPQTGLLVDSVEGMTDLSAEQLQALPATTSDARARWLTGQIYLYEKPVFMLTLAQWPGAIEAVAIHEGAKR